MALREALQAIQYVGAVRNLADSVEDRKFQLEKQNYKRMVMESGALDIREKEALRPERRKKTELELKSGIEDLREKESERSENAALREIKRREDEQKIQARRMDRINSTVEILKNKIDDPATPREERRELMLILRDAQRALTATSRELLGAAHPGNDAVSQITIRNGIDKTFREIEENGGTENDKQQFAEAVADRYVAEAGELETIRAGQLSDDDLAANLVYGEEGPPEGEEDTVALAEDLQEFQQLAMDSAMQYYSKMSTEEGSIESKRQTAIAMALEDLKDSQLSDGEKYHVIKSVSAGMKAFVGMERQQVIAKVLSSGITKTGDVLLQIAEEFGRDIENMGPDAIRTMISDAFDSDPRETGMAMFAGNILDNSDIVERIVRNDKKLTKLIEAGKGRSPEARVLATDGIIRGLQMRHAENEYAYNALENIRKELVTNGRFPNGPFGMVLKIAENRYLQHVPAEEEQFNLASKDAKNVALLNEEKGLYTVFGKGNEVFTVVPIEAGPSGIKVANAFSGAPGLPPMWAEMRSDYDPVLEKTVEDAAADNGAVPFFTANYASSDPDDIVADMMSNAGLSAYADVLEKYGDSMAGQKFEMRRLKDGRIVPVPDTGGLTKGVKPPIPLQRSRRLKKSAERVRGALVVLQEPGVADTIHQLTGGGLNHTATEEDMLRTWTDKSKGDEWSRRLPEQIQVSVGAEETRKRSGIMPPTLLAIRNMAKKEEIKEQLEALLFPEWPAIENLSEVEKMQRAVQMENRARVVLLALSSAGERQAELREGYMGAVTLGEGDYSTAYQALNLTMRALYEAGITREVPNKSPDFERKTATSHKFQIRNGVVQ